MIRLRATLSSLVIGGAFALAAPVLGQSAPPADGMSMPAKDRAPAAPAADMKPDMKMMGMKATGGDEKPMMMMDECMKMHADIVALRAEISALRAELKAGHTGTRQRRKPAPRPPVPQKAPPGEHQHNH